MIKQINRSAKWQNTDKRFKKQRPNFLEIKATAARTSRNIISTMTVL